MILASLVSVTLLILRVSIFGHNCMKRVVCTEKNKVMDAYFVELLTTLGYCVSDASIYTVFHA